MSDAPCMATGWRGVDAALRSASAWRPAGGDALAAASPVQHARDVLDAWRARVCGVACASGSSLSERASEHASPDGGLVVAGVHEFLGEAGPPLGLLGRLAGRFVAAAGARGGKGEDTVVWVGRRVWPDLPALARLGRASGVDVPGVSLFVDPADAVGRWWCGEHSVRSGAACCVVLDGAGATLTVTRRLHLAAVEAGVTVLLARNHDEAACPSAAMTRWRVRRLMPVIDRIEGATHPPRARWLLDLLRCKGRQAFHPSGDRMAVQRAGASALASWMLEWDHVHGPVDLPADLADRPRSEASSSPRAGRSGSPDPDRAPRRRAADRRRRMRSVPASRGSSRHGVG